MSEAFDLSYFNQATKGTLNKIIGYAVYKGQASLFQGFDERKNPIYAITKSRKYIAIQEDAGGLRFVSSSRCHIFDEDLNLTDVRGLRNRFIGVCRVSEYDGYLGLPKGTICRLVAINTIEEEGVPRYIVQTPDKDVVFTDRVELASKTKRT